MKCDCKDSLEEEGSEIISCVVTDIAYPVVDNAHYVYILKYWSLWDSNSYGVSRLGFGMLGST